MTLCNDKDFTSTVPVPIGVDCRIRIARNGMEIGLWCQLKLLRPCSAVGAYHGCCHTEERESRAGRWWVAALSFDFLQLMDSGPESARGTPKYVQRDA